MFSFSPFQLNIIPNIESNCQNYTRNGRNIQSKHDILFLHLPIISILLINLIYDNRIPQTHDIDARTHNLYHKQSQGALVHLYWVLPVVEDAFGIVAQVLAHEMLLFVDHGFLNLGVGVALLCVLGAQEEAQV